MSKAIDLIIILLLFIITIFTRPSILGGKYSYIVIVISFLVLVIYMLTNNIKIKINKRNKVMIILNTMFWIYIYIHSLINNSINIDWVLSLTIISIIVVFVFLVILNNKKLNKKFFRFIIFIFLTMGISYIITLILSIFLPLESMKLFQINIDNYSYAGNVYFPLTIVYGTMSTNGLTFIRAQSFFRESGIAQAFMIWAYFSMDKFGFQKKRYRILILLNIISTFSTTAIVIFIVTYICSKLEVNDKISKKRIAILPIGIMLSIGLLIYTPYIGIKDKLLTHGLSINERTTMMQRGVFLLKEYPWGIGIYNKILDDYWNYNANINLIAMSYKIGIIGVLFILILYIIPGLYDDNKIKYYIYMIPFFATMITSQPLVDAIIIYVFLIANYDEYGG